MGFKVIETEEEVRSAHASGLLWYNASAQMPRDNRWMRVHANATWPVDDWNMACQRESVGVRVPQYDIPEDYAVLVEDDGEGDSPTASEECDSTTTVSGD